MTLHFHSLRVKSVQPDSEEAVVISFDVPEPLVSDFRFNHGQHLTLRRTFAGVEQRRSYSICGSVDDGILRIGVRKVPGGVFSTWLNEGLSPGETIDVMPPDGRFFVPLEPGVGRRYLGIAGGSGITPILSILSTVLQREPLSHFTLIYGNRRQRSAMFLEEMHDLKDRYLARLALHLLFSQEQMDSALLAGRLDRAKLGQFFGPLIDASRIDHAFICGPQGVDDEATAALLHAGLAADRIHVERFGVMLSQEGRQPRRHAAPGHETLARVAIVRDGLSREIEFTPRHDNVLQAAVDAGLDLPYSCRSGVCSTCRAKLLEGEVTMARNFALDAQEVAAGFVLTCQAQPVSQRVVLSFDER